MRNRLLQILLLTLLFAASFGQLPALSKPPLSDWKPSEGAELIGKKAPEFSGLTWVNSKPMTLSSLRGKLVFIRFWFAECPMCRQSVRTLNYLQKTYGPRGLVVIGIHHPKGLHSPLEDADKLDVVMHQWGIDFPVAMDNDWKRLKKLWSYQDHDFTSGSVLIDRNGNIRWVHPGGVLGLPQSLGGDQKSPAFESLRVAIEGALSEQRI